MREPSKKLLLASSISLALLTMSGTVIGQSTSQRADQTDAQTQTAPRDATQTAPRQAAQSASQDSTKTAAMDVTNARHEAQIETTFALSPYLRGHDINVAVVDGKVTLTGTVDEDVNKDLAEAIAKGAPGVTGVENNLTVNANHVPAARNQTTGERSYAAIVEDASISAAIKSKLLWSKHNDGLDTTVETMDGDVKLTGTAASAEAKELAGKLAKDTRGVMKVDNQLAINTSARESTANANAGSTGQAISDTWITTKVKSTYMMSSNIHSGDIDVSTRQGVVTLTGKAQSGAESALAVELAENINGVKSVDSKGLTFDN